MERVKMAEPYRLQIVWSAVIIVIYLHVVALYGVFLAFTSAKVFTTIFALLFHAVTMMGVTAGVHRLWSHRSYKAKWPLRLFLMIMHTVAFQGPIYHWVRDHRVHHKSSETNADPYNSTRGFFFSHVGWLMVRKHPDVMAKGKTIDMSDIRMDPIVMFQKKYYWKMMPLVCFVLPPLVPMYFWGENFVNAWCVGTIIRCVLTQNMTFLINSAAHKWGNKPYDRHIAPAENLGVSLGTLGEGWHNYHHTFPWDYRQAELGHDFNATASFIDACARVGLAYELKSVPECQVRQRAERTGDGSRGVWGWGDKDMSPEHPTTAHVRQALTSGN